MTHNHYLPPVGPVADSPIGSSLARQVKIALALIWISLLVLLAGLFVMQSTPTIKYTSPKLFIQLVLIPAFFVISIVVPLAIYIRRAGRWARILFAGFTAFLAYMLIDG